MTLASVHIVGTGLIGTSVGLALGGRPVTVLLSDRDPSRVRFASELGAGQPGPDRVSSPADVVLICVPPADVAVELERLQDLNLGRAYSDVASIKAKPQAEAQAIGANLSTFVGGHPIAGRERGGPAMARADLFLGRPWVLTPSAETSTAALELVRELVRECGAVPVQMDAPSHDATLALISHAPQALASLLAARLVDTDATTAQLAGQGLRDLTRIADSDPDLWAQIAHGNAGPLADVLRSLAADLTNLAHALDTSAGQGSAAFRAVVAAGNAGRLRLPGKHGARAARYATVPVVVSDEPGALARLLLDAGDAGINVEDLSLEHSPGAPVGLCELFVQPSAADSLAAVLTERGWVVHQAHGASPDG